MKRLLIVGCGDVALRVATRLHARYQLFGLVRNLDRYALLRQAGITPIWGDLDRREQLARLGGVAEIVLHFAPPPILGKTDTRTRHLLAALGRNPPRRLIYISTSGVYGDCGGDWVSETSRVHPQSLRAQRRVDAESQIRRWAQRNQVSASILRVPGIYAGDRLPLERLAAGTPAILTGQDGYTNHIHADDLASIAIAAIRYARPNRIYHASDDSDLKMGDYFDLVADAYQLPRPVRLSRNEVQEAVTPMLWSFMAESRRLTNHRMKKELKVILRYPSVSDALPATRST